MFEKLLQAYQVIMPKFINILFIFMPLIAFGEVNSSSANRFSDNDSFRERNTEQRGAISAKLISDSDSNLLAVPSWFYQVEVSSSVGSINYSITTEYSDSLTAEESGVLRSRSYNSTSQKFFLTPRLQAFRLLPDRIRR